MAAKVLRSPGSKVLRPLGTKSRKPKPGDSYHSKTNQILAKLQQQQQATSSSKNY